MFFYSKITHDTSKNELNFIQSLSYRQKIHEGETHWTGCNKYSNTIVNVHKQ